MRSRRRNIYERYGNIFFVTSTVVGFIDLFSDEGLAGILINNLNFYQSRGDFLIIAYVIMPDHFQLILKVNQPQTISQCIANFKRITSRQITDYLGKFGKHEIILSLKIAVQKSRHGKARLWQPRFDCLVINNEDTLRQKVACIHSNPIRRGLVGTERDWPYSSAGNYEGLKNCIVPVETDWNKLID